MFWDGHELKRRMTGHFFPLPHHWFGVWALGCVLPFGCRPDIINPEVPQLDVATCDDKGQCPEGSFCIDTTGIALCKSVEELACRDQQAPKLFYETGSPNKKIDFGPANPGQVQTLTIANNGNCMLNIQRVDMVDDGQRSFGCEPCGEAAWGQHSEAIAPGHAIEIDVTYFGGTKDAVEGLIKIEADDESLTEDDKLIDIFADYKGNAELQLSRENVDYGFVEYTPGVAQNQSRRETITACNVGDGNAGLDITILDLSIKQDYQILQPAEIAPDKPYTLYPSECVDIEVAYTPSDFQESDSTLWITWTDGEQTQAATAYLFGSSLGPAKLVISHEAVNVLDLQGNAVAVGNLGTEQFTIANDGQSKLIVNMKWLGEADEFEISPALAFDSELIIPPQAKVPFFVLYNPSEASDPTNPDSPDLDSAAAAKEAFLLVSSNDPETATDDIAIRGWARAGVADDALLLELTYDNDNNGWANNDLRDVDLELGSPLGYVCAEEEGQDWVELPDGTWRPGSIKDPCAEWTATGQLGVVKWFGSGQYEEPERIVLYGLGQDLANAQRFPIRITYARDCFELSGTLEDVLSLGGSLAIQALGGWIGIDLKLSPNEIKELIDNRCSKRRGTTATVKVMINGEEIATIQEQLPEIKDMPEPTVEIGVVKRENGVFTLE